MSLAGHVVLETAVRGSVSVVNSPRPAFSVDAHLQWDVSDELFASYRDLIYREAGIALTDQKKALLVSRLAGRLRELGLRRSTRTTVWS